MYCSPECQKTDWAHHKIVCDLNRAATSQQDTSVGPGEKEPLLRRRLRLFTSRVANSLTVATIGALHLREHPENIDRLAMIIRLQPREHYQSGARLSIDSADVVSMETLKEILTGDMAKHGAAFLKQHHIEKEKIKKETRGNSDYATMLLVVANVGPEALPGDDHATELRFRPINVHKGMINSPQLAASQSDWFLNLRIQIDMDMPMRVVI